jgi:diacylglycerol kinase (ATP)
MKPGKTGLARVIDAFGYSMQGLKAAYQYEAAFRQEVILGIPLIILAFWVADTGAQLALLIGSVLLVMMIEILNSAIEAVVDRFGGELHELSGRAKDMGSAAVFLSLLNVGVIWLAILFF